MIAPRRAFLRGLATLPLIGGGVTLIGQPKAVAEPASALALAHYANWLLIERRVLCYELAKGDIGKAMVLAAAEAGPQPDFHCPPGAHWTTRPMPSSRALLVMATVGFDWREPGSKKATALQID